MRAAATHRRMRGSRSRRRLIRRICSGTVSPKITPEPSEAICGIFFPAACRKASLCCRRIARGKVGQMSRVDDDTWDLSESVGATALGTAESRAKETSRQHPLFTDPYAQLFLDAAVARGVSYSLLPTR
jgi:hypothetical protein